MRRARVAMTTVCACLLAATAAPASYFVYAPRPTEEDAPRPKVAEQEILVQEITINKGDTLSSISRTFSGRAAYFPQILLFNRIEDPDLIFAGATLRVPVTKTATETTKERRTSSGKGTVKKRKKEKVRQDREAAATAAPAGERPRQREEATAEQRLYQRGIEAYRMGRCEESIALFDAFLKQFPGAPNVPDASLLRADCRLKLSEQ